MATPQRGAILSRLQKVLRKHYKPADVDLSRPVLEQAVVGLLLENARHEVAEAMYAALPQAFFDWNEVRVASVKELAELLARLPDPAAAATNVRKFLQSVFDAHYAFDLEAIRKLTLGQAQDKLQKLPGITPFAVAWVTQTSLGGHSIPLDRGALQALAIVGAITDEQAARGVSPGLERAVPKNRGIEFGSLLHQLGAELVASPFSTNLHKVLLEINPECKGRLPKRAAKKPEEPPPAVRPSARQAKGGRAAPKPEPSAAERPKSPASKDKPAPRAAAQGAAKSALASRASTAGLPKRKPR
jgi:endonuclease III